MAAIAAGVVDDRGRRARLAARERGGNAGHVQRRSQDVTLADRRVGGVAVRPRAGADALLIGGVGYDQGPGGRVGQLVGASVDQVGDVRQQRRVESEAAGFRGQSGLTEADPHHVVPDVAGDGQHLLEVHLAVAGGIVLGEIARPDAEARTALEDVVPIHDAMP